MRLWLGSLLLTVLLCGLNACRAEHVRVLFADAVFVVFDADAEDFFVFYAPPQVSDSPTLGVSGQGLELKPVLGAQSSNPGNPVLAAPAQGQSATPRVRAYENEMPEVSLSSDALAYLANNCASCHKRGTKLAGDFAMFGNDGRLLSGVDWPLVARRVRDGEMPLPGSGKSAPTPEVRIELDKVAETLRKK